MGLLNLCGNIIWILGGGWLIALLYFLGGLGLIVTICGIPFGIQALKLARMAIWPFGYVVRERYTAGPLTVCMNIIWVLTFGWIIGVVHLILGIFFTITICGIPFGRQHFKMIQLGMFPFGKDILSKSEGLPR